MKSRLFAVAFDCTDAGVVGRFWAQALGRELDPGAGKQFASIGLHDSGRIQPRLCFVQVVERRSAMSRLHPDLITCDLEAEVGRLIQLGASRKEAAEMDGRRWATLLDPEGNELTSSRWRRSSAPSREASTKACPAGRTSIERKQS